MAPIKCGSSLRRDQGRPRARSLCQPNVQISRRSSQSLYVRSELATKNVMTSKKKRITRILAFVGGLSLLVWKSAAQQMPAKTFDLKISLAESSIHTGDRPMIKVITSNSTDHIVYASEGCGGGMGAELINSAGEDIGLHAMGGGETCKHPAFILTGSREALRPGTVYTFMWHLKPEPGYLVPGAYKLRVYRRDVTSGDEVFSNRVTLAILP